MASKPAAAPAFFSLVVFLGVNYVIGYAIGQVLTGSTMVSAGIALLTPLLSVVGLALFGSKRGVGETSDGGTLEKA